jgi:prophage DNA circulation protein
VSWDTQLELAAFRGLTFEVLATDDTLARRVVEAHYPFKDGADLDDIGRSARPTRVTAVFHGREYLEDLVAFLKVVDEGETGPFRHPLLGTWNAKVLSVGVRHSSERRNYAEVELELKEDGTSTQIPDVAIGSAQQELASAVAEAQSEYDDLGEEVAEVETAIADATAFQADAIAIEDDLTGRLERLRFVCNAAVDKVLGELDQVEVYPLVRAIRQAALTGRQLKERLEQLHMQVMLRPTSAVAPLATVANRLYGDAGRATELTRLNRIRNPFLVPVGKELKVYAA